MKVNSKKIREDFDEVISHWSGAMVNKISISCGYVYSREKNWESFEEIASEADIRMYEAKEKYYSVEGRDRRRKSKYRQVNEYIKNSFICRYFVIKAVFRRSWRDIHKSDENRGRCTGGNIAGRSFP